MKNRPLASLLLALALIAVSGISTARAMPVTVTSGDTLGCDVLFTPAALDELGDPAGFPVGEKIAHTAAPTLTSACPAMDNPSIVNAIVTITNLQSFSFTDLWYVAGVGVTFSNVDGLINGSIAFKIDSVGVNAPLLVESITMNGIFQPGEIWEFVVQDFTSGGPPPDAFLTPGVVGGGDPVVSIVAIPEPSILAALQLAAIVLAIRRRRA